ncbi:TetR/AcrR family transcriptional regulator [Deinococcus sonorensis]|uniref:TetR/AcrR family transcriptional regulator n=2 Tax=Deinococcus sonorensis TaxID=309891 RepID=A0AAU7U774_9DEIO
MMRTQSASKTRAGSPHKRERILEAARTLFLTEGYERTSVDAISARAEVSKRTVYDYFGDKEAVFVAVVEAAKRTLMASVQAALDDELTEGRDLGAALLGFTRRVATDTFSSSSYVVLRKLLVTEAARFPLPGQPAGDTPETKIAERFATLTQVGLLEAPNALRAAEHFTALTFVLALDHLGQNSWRELGSDDLAEIDPILVDGVAAFLRAYGPLRRLP